MLSKFTRLKRLVAGNAAWWLKIQLGNQSHILRIYCWDCEFPSAGETLRNPHLISNSHVSIAFSLLCQRRGTETNTGDEFFSLCSPLWGNRPFGGATQQAKNSAFSTNVVSHNRLKAAVQAVGPLSH